VEPVGFCTVREQGADRLVAVPSRGRLYRASRRARFGDVSPRGRTRFDALARFLQDVSSDDSADAGLDDALAWVVRRTVFEVRQPAVFREMLELTTFCSGLGSRWAERRVSIRGEQGASIEAATIWVRIDIDSGRPLTVGEQFQRLYAEAAGGRHVTARLQLPSRPPDGATKRQRWPLRFSDFDLLGHVNNAASWAIVEQELADRDDLTPPYRAELEYRDAIERHHDVDVVRLDGEDLLQLWAVDADGPADVEAFVTARVTRLDT
jgi:acyl-ACP thioesterase